MMQLFEHINWDEVSNCDNKQMQRLLHGRGFRFNGYTHINIDWFSPVILIILYKEESDQWLGQLCEALREKMHSIGFEVESVLVQYRCRAFAPTEVLYGEPVSDLIGRENSLSYHLNFGSKQNYGIFLDMKKGREWVQANSKNKNVLNLFSYTCAFSVAAVAGGAKQVVNLDMSKAALSVGRENHRLNGHDLSRVKYLGVDLFKSWGRVKRPGPYDLLIADPPSLQKGSVNIKRDYPKIMRRLPELLTENGQALLCLNSPDLDFQFIYDCLAEHCPRAEVLEVIKPEPHFININPDQGLKCVLVELREI